MPADWKRGWQSFAFAMVGLAGLMWVAYFWESSTGVTWATRRRLGRPSTPESLERARNIAIGTTILGGTFGVVYYLTRPRPR